MFAIQERKTKELKLVKEAESLSELIENAPFPIYQCHGDYRYEYVNKAYTLLTGLTSDQARGYGWMSALSQEQSKRLFLEQNVKMLSEEDNLLLIKDTHGVDRWVRSSTLAKSELSSSELTLGMLLDVTDQIRNQDAMKQKTQELEISVQEAERLAQSKAEFLAVVFHEIRFVRA